MNFQDSDKNSKSNSVSNNVPNKLNLIATQTDMDQNDCSKDQTISLDPVIQTCGNVIVGTTESDSDNDIPDLDDNTENDNIPPKKMQLKISQM